MYLIETGGPRFLMWGDNRHAPPESVWERIGRVDVLALPVDGRRSTRLNSGRFVLNREAVEGRQRDFLYSGDNTAI